MKKLPKITIAFWIIKICATTLGETTGDLMSMTLNIGYGWSSIILLLLFIIVLSAQLISKKHIPPLYWAVILATSTAGTTMSDYMDRTLGLGYAKGSMLLVILLASTLFLWKKTENSLNITTINSFRGEIFYWTAILFSNTLGTALGDFIATNTGLGFLGGALLIASLLLIIALSYYFLTVSHIVLFWLAFILTRPFGATFGDLLTKPIEKGGLNLGTIGSSLLLFIILCSLIFFSNFKNKNTEKVAV
jgi:uncharacterized membrane-anchored protein